MTQSFNHQHAYPAARKPGHLSRRALTGLLCVLLALQPMLAQAAPALAPPATLQAGGHLALLAPKLSARGDITLKAERGRVYLGAGKDSDYIHEDYSKTGWFKWASGEQGRYDETVRLPEMKAGGTLRIEAGSGVVVDYKLAGNLNESIASLSRLPELAWMGRLKGRADIDWRAIEEVHDHWQRHESGLGGPGVTLVALAVGAYLGGIDFSQLLGTGLEGSMAAGFNAGMTSLSARAGVSLAAHGGDIGAVFEDLLSSDTLLAVATAGLTGVDPIPPTPFVWIKSAGDILDRIPRFCLRAFNSVHLGSVYPICAGPA